MNSCQVLEVCQRKMKIKQLTSGTPDLNTTQTPAVDLCITPIKCQRQSTDTTQVLGYCRGRSDLRPVKYPMELPRGPLNLVILIITIKINS